VAPAEQKPAFLRAGMARNNYHTLFFAGPVWLQAIAGESFPD